MSITRIFFWFIKMPSILIRNNKNEIFI
jgi:hypothetical protein